MRKTTWDIKNKEIDQDTAGADGQNRRRWKTMV